MFNTVNTSDEIGRFHYYLRLRNRPLKFPRTFNLVKERQELIKKLSNPEYCNIKATGSREEY